MKRILFIAPMFIVLLHAQTVMVFLEISNKSDKQVKLEISDISLSNENDTLKLDIKEKNISSMSNRSPQILIGYGRTQNKKFTHLNLSFSKINTFAGSAKIEPKLNTSKFVFSMPPPISAYNPGVITLQWNLEKDFMIEGKYSASFTVIEPTASYVNAAGAFSVPSLNIIAFFDRSTNKIHRILSTGKNPTGLAYNSNQKTLYVSNQGSHTISSMNFPNFDTHNELQLRLGDGPTKLACNDASNTLYVLNSESNSISIIDGYSGQETDRIQLEFNPMDIEYSKNSAELYIGGESNFLWVYNSLNYQEITRINVSSYIKSLELNEMDNELMVSCENSRQALFLNSTSKKVLRKSSLCESASHIVFEAPTRSSLFSIPLCNQISIFKWGNQYEINNIKLFGQPGFLALSPDNQFIYALMKNKNEIAIINSNNLKILTQMETGGIPAEIIFLE